LRNAADRHRTIRRGPIAHEKAPPERGQGFNARSAYPAAATVRKAGASDAQLALALADFERWWLRDRRQLLSVARIDVCHGAGVPNLGLKATRRMR